MRWSERVFVAEGIELARTAFSANVVPEAIFLASGSSDDRHVAELVEWTLSKGARVFELAPGVAERVADTVTPPAVFCIHRMLDVGIDDVDRSLVIVCVDVRDPGNAGTVIRTADAAGAGAVVFTGGSVDPYNPKTVRSTAGSIFHVALVVATDSNEAIHALQEKGTCCVGSVIRGGDDYRTFDWDRSTAIVIGNEARGLPASTLESLDGLVGIPMAGRAESLNVAVACAVLCFEAVRNRSTMPGMSKQSASDPDRPATRPDS